MTGIKKSILLLLLSTLVCVLALCGCNEAVTNNPGGGGITSVNAGNTKNALLKQIDRKFDNPDAHYQLGQIYHKEGLYDQAAHEYNVALSFEPAHRDTQAALIKLFLDQGNTLESQRKADLFMSQVSGSAKESLKLARALEGQKADRYVLTCYNQALRLAPESAEAFKYIGYYYLSQGDKDQAKQHLSRSFQIDSSQWDVAGELGGLGVEVKVPQPPVKESLWQKIRRKFGRKEM